MIKILNFKGKFFIFSLNVEKNYFYVYLYDPMLNEEKLLV